MSSFISRLFFQQKDPASREAAAAAAGEQQPGSAHGGGGGGASSGEAALTPTTTATTQRAAMLMLDPVRDAVELADLARRSNITTIAVPQYRIRSSFVEYVVECSKGSTSWRVYRRYQQFKALDQSLRQLCTRGTPHHGEYGVLPALPGSHWMEITNQSSELVDRRRRFLDIYLQQLLVPKNLFYVARTALYAFLHDGEVLVEKRTSRLQPLLGFFLRASVGRGAQEVQRDTCPPATSSIDDNNTTSNINIHDGASNNDNHVHSSSTTQSSDSPPAGRESEPQPQHESPKAAACTSGMNATSAAEGGHDPLTAPHHHHPDTIEPWTGDDVPSESGECIDGGGDERLPPLAPRCLHCSSEFTSSRYPHRCFFCRNRFCCHCLWKLPLDTYHASVSPATRKRVNACHQCTENYRRRYTRVVLDAAGGTSSGASPTYAFPATAMEPTTTAAELLGNTTTTTTAAAPLTTPSLRPASAPGRVAVAAAGGDALRLAVSPLLCGGGSPVPQHQRACGLQDFQLLTVLGRGTFGKVMKVRRRSSGEVLALKVLNKAVVYKRCMTSYIREEKHILTTLPPHPYVVNCHYAFQSDYYLFFALDYLPGGELFDLIYPQLRIRPEDVRHYVAELVLALEHIHKYDVVHRDVKPENIVLDADGHVKLTDFGLARRNFSKSGRRSFVGSAEYLAPEVIRGEPQTAALDWWSLGVLLYEMLDGRAPFHAENNNAVYDNVIQKDIDFSDKSTDVFTADTISLITTLLDRNPKTRLQASTAIKTHAYFAGIDWAALRERSVPAPYQPSLIDNDTRHFKRQFTAEWAAVPLPPRTMTRTSLDAMARCFDNFPYVQDAHPHSKRSTPPPPPSCSVSTSNGGGGGGDAPSLPCTDNDAIKAADVMGVWRAVSVETRALDGRLIYPWGGDVTGVLVYSKEGLYSMQLSPRGRSPLPDGRSDQSSKEELCSALDTFMAHCGRYVVHDDSQTLEHHPFTNVHPNMAETALTLYYELTNTQQQQRLADAAEGDQPPSLKLPSPAVVGEMFTTAAAASSDMFSSRSPSPLPPHRILLQLTTEPQLVRGESFQAQTVLLWERVEEC